MNIELQQKKQQDLAHLQQLQTWGAAQGNQLLEQKKEYSSEVVAYQNQYDQAVIAEMQQQVPQVQVLGAAQVQQPPVQQPPAQEGYKARREREKKRKAALKVCPVGNEYTLDMANEIKAQIAAGSLAITPELSQLAEQNDCDRRMLKSFCQDINLDKRGRPATPEDAQILQQNRQFVRDYCTGDAQQREPYLTRFVDEMINYNYSFKPDSLSDENIRKNIRQYKSLADKTTYIESLQRENPQFFANLPAYKKEALEAQTAVAASFVFALVTRMRAMGIDFNQGNTYGYEFSKSIADDDASSPEIISMYQNSLPQLKTDVRAAAEKEAMRLVATDMFDDLVDSYQQQDDLFVKIYGVSLPGGASEIIYADIAKYRNMIADHPDKYEQNRELIDRLYGDFYKIQSQRGELFVLQRKLNVITFDNNGSPDLLLRTLSAAADRLNDAKNAEETTHAHYANTLTDVFEHILRGKPLTDAASALLARFANANNAGASNGENE